jgi:transposase
VVPDYHPAYGLDDSTRARVLSLIILDSLPVKQAAVLNNVGLSTVYRWVSHSKKGL